jgi:PAS domain S-box-containing protein
MTSYLKSLRGRLLLLVVLSALPGIWLVYDTAQTHRRVEIADSRSELLGLSRLAALEFRRIINSGKHAAIALSGHQAIRGMREPECSNAISGFLTHAERYLNIVVMDAEGKAVCSGLPLMDRKLDFSDRDYFLRAVKTTDPVVGRPTTGRITQRIGVPVSYRIRDDAGQTLGVVTPLLDLSWFADAFVRAELLPEMTFAILDAEGTVLLRYPEPERWGGKKIGNSPLIAAIRQAGGEGNAETVGLDGVQRVYGFAPIRMFEGQEIYISIGVPLKSLIEEQEALFRATLISLALIAGIALAVAWLFGARLIWRQVKTLTDTAHRLAGGDLDARVGAPYWQSELGELARVLDRTAGAVKENVEALKRSEEEVRRLNADLERRVAERTAQLEAAMREAEDLYENAPCGYHSVDENGIFLRINNTWLEWLGYSREEVVGRLRHSDVMTPASAKLFEEKFALFKQQGWLKDVEFEYVRKDGSVLAASLNATTIYDAEGRYVMSRSTVFDITERKKAEVALRERDQEITLKNRQLEEASRMKSEFLANMSHELRTPLNAIIGFSEAMRDGLVGELTPGQKEFASDIFNSGEHLLELINDILDLSKVEAGMMTLEHETMDVSTLVNMGLAIVREKATGHRIRLHAEVEAGLRLVADLRKCKQILYNLLSNAVKFTPEGGEIRVRARRIGRDDMHDAIATGMAEFRIPLPNSGAAGFLELTVADTGIGMPAEELGRLFQPFVQLDSSLARKHQGTGLGLAMVRRLAELHGGTVGVASREGGGTVFAVWLPLQEEDAAAPAPLARAAISAEADGTAKAAPRVLVVEDNDRATLLLRTQLENEGFAVRQVRSAEEALAFLARERPDVITLDIRLPGMDGWEFLERIKASPNLADIPVVIVSIVAEARQGFALGAAQVLQKPVTREALADAMGRIGFRPEASRTTVLVVDDDPAAVTLLAAHLEASGYAAQRAFGGGEAIETTRHLLPDLILLDLLMPEVSGFDVVEALKRDPRTAQIPIIVVTSKEITPEDRAALNGHVEFIMSKSAFSQESFINEVRRALRRRRLRNANGAP